MRKNKKDLEPELAIILFSFLQKRGFENVPFNLSENFISC